MLIAPHAAAGAAIAVLAPHPLISVPLAIVSHYALDTVPHWQESLPPYPVGRASFIRIPIDVALALGFVWFAAALHPADALNIWVTAGAATIPDIDTLVLVVPSLLKVKTIKRHWDWHAVIQRETASYRGLVPQIVVCLLALCLMLSF